jgi:hypothetical protein
MGIFHGRQAVKDYILKSKTFCLDCKTEDKSVLTFHHRDGEEKLFDIADGPRKRLGAVKREIAKCDVYCRLCHDKLHGIISNSSTRRPSHRISGAQRRKRKKLRLREQA